MERSCSMSSMRRCSFMILPSTCSRMSACSLHSSTSFLSSSSTARARSGTLSVSSTPCSVASSALVSDAAASTSRDMSCRSMDPVSDSSVRNCSPYSGLRCSRSRMVLTSSMEVALRMSSLVYDSSRRCSTCTRSGSPEIVACRLMRLCPSSSSCAESAVSPARMVCTCANVPTSYRCDAGSPPPSPPPAASLPPLPPLPCLALARLRRDSVRPPAPAAVSLPAAPLLLAASAAAPPAASLPAAPGLGGSSGLRRNAPTYGCPPCFLVSMISLMSRSFLVTMTGV
mmetsp:Transcript_28790/g.73374  ORF Transcript_28790/g.73374 Transcript_28790/m.73374 type:complete len:285 (+) Transcript_28790:2038-2892(+)